MVPHGDRVYSAESRTVQHQCLGNSFRRQKNVVRVLILNHNVDDLPLRTLHKTPRDHARQRAQVNDQGRERMNWEHNRNHT